MSGSSNSSGGGGGGGGGGSNSNLNYYWVDDGNNLQGPIGPKQLLQLETDEYVTEDTMCIREGDDEYTSYGSLRSELRYLLLFFKFVLLP